MTSNSQSNEESGGARMHDRSLHYFTGKIKAFWNNHLFFSDRWNVAAVDVCDVYVNGRPASYRDLAFLEERMQRSRIDPVGCPELHAYVQEYHGKINCPWPQQLAGMALWEGVCAWYGFIPQTLKINVFCKTVYMPLSYYTGRIVEFFPDKILFGDPRNSVIVSRKDFYGFNDGRNWDVHRPPCYNEIMHAYVMRLDVLSDNRLIGPVPHLPSWPIQPYNQDMWVAKFAWQGEMPEIVRDQVKRFNILRMNQWNDISSVPWVMSGNERSTTYEEFCQDDKRREACRLIPIEQNPGVMKGTLLMSDSDNGLMTSYADMIAFHKENFYINGNKFKQNYDLSYYFHKRVVPLTAWVVPLEKPKVVLSMNVVWHAVCVWFGDPPPELEDIKKKFSLKKPLESPQPLEADASSNSVKFTHFIGRVRNVSFAYGVLICRAGLEKDIKVSFKKKAILIKGEQLNSRAKLVERRDFLESRIWSVLAYPTWKHDTKDVPDYQALAMWVYDDQHLIHDTLFTTVTEFKDLRAVLPNYKCVQNLRDIGTERKNFFGWIVKVTEKYGIIQIGTCLLDDIYVYFKKQVLYIDGEPLPKGDNLVESIKEGTQCTVDAGAIPPKAFDGYKVTMEGAQVWIGKKPELDTEPELCPWPENILYVAEGRVKGDILMADDQRGLIICSNTIVAFSSDSFYPNGSKFIDKHNSLKDFCSDRKFTVQAMVVTLKEPKFVLNCFVMCEAVCVWTGPEPDDLVTLLKAHDDDTQGTDDDPSVAQRPLFYFQGRMTPVSENITLLASTTPEGIANIIFSKENLFLNGDAVYQKSIFEQYKRKSHDWSVLAIPIPPKDVKGHSVKFAAVAVWNMSQHHRMRMVLMSACFPHDDVQESEHEGASTTDYTNGLPEDKADEEYYYHTEDDHEIFTEGSVASGVQDNGHTNKVHPRKEECFGKHIAAFIVKKSKKGGIAEWKSLQLEGIVYIAVSKEVLYFDMNPVSSNQWKGVDVESRPCNLYAMPVPPYTVDNFTVSLKATCGWIGKKPSHIPSPGTQLMPKIDLSNVHVSPVPQVKEFSSDETDDEDDLNLNIVWLRTEIDRDGNYVVFRNKRSFPVSTNYIDFDKYCSENAKKNDTNGTQNGEPSKTTNSKDVKPTPAKPQEKPEPTQTAKSKSKSAQAPQVKNKPMQASQGKGKQAQASQDKSKQPQQSQGKTKPAQTPEAAKNKPAQQSQGKNKAAQPSQTKNKPAQKSQAKNKPAQTSQAENKPAQTSQAKNKPAQSSQGKNKPDQAAQGKKKETKASQDKNKQTQATQAKPKPPIVVQAKPKPGQAANVKNETSQMSEFQIEPCQVSRVGTDSCPPPQVEVEPPHVPQVGTEADRVPRNQQNESRHIHQVNNNNNNNNNESPRTPQIRSGSTTKPMETFKVSDEKSLHRGDIFEVHSSVGQVLGEDGSVHFFSRDCCYLHGVPLSNVELWHVLAQGEPVLYSVMELVPGMVKVQKVFAGLTSVTAIKDTAEHINEWCEEKMVPDGARDILLSQLESRAGVIWDAAVV